MYMCVCARADSSTLRTRCVCLSMMRRRSIKFLSFLTRKCSISLSFLLVSFVILVGLNNIITFPQLSSAEDSDSGGMAVDSLLTVHQGRSG